MSRRLEKVARTLQATVGEVIQGHLSDPRIRGLISVTRVEPAPDLRSCRVYLSVLGVDEKQQELSLRGIRHARGHIQHLLARRISFKTCPTLDFYLDDSLKKGYQMVRLLDQVAAEREQPESQAEHNPPEKTVETEDEK